ncbi:MAG: hypothetical protein M1819_002520 [Sarea resinae]|nr:MAG: hypothetical protein M1819_002520 [Sarea resinae]
MATLVMQALGCEVAALNTVQFSNHTGYGQFKGTKASAQEIRDLYDGLKQSYLNDFDVMLTGYIPGAEALDAVGTIARDQKLKSSTKPGSFFWVLDPVMGDQGQLYVPPAVVPAYKNLLKDADLILPNQFEASLLSDTPIDDFDSLATALATLHTTHHIPHIVVTSISFSADSPMLAVVGSTARSDGSPRLFRVDVPAIDCYFSGTGDMFAALTVVRLREAVCAVPGLSTTRAWVSPDAVDAVDLPLARAVQMVLGSMHAVLAKTKAARDDALAGLDAQGVLEREQGSDRRLHLRKTKAAEIRLVRCLADLREPHVRYEAVPF